MNVVDSHLLSSRPIYVTARVLENSGRNRISKASAWLIYDFLLGSQLPP